MDISFLCTVKSPWKIRTARREDCPSIFELICELAEFERAADEVVITEEQLAEDTFGKRPILEVLVLEKDSEILAAAMIYEKYSTWKGRAVHLEDLIVKEAHRGNGYGAALFEAVMDIAKERNYSRMDWQVLDWNKPAIDFYKKYGAHFLDEWVDCRFTTEEIKKR
ncbi:MAG: GNAT family N-acetyltransferase [Flavobacteriales bacterium]|nr:GNAT family N-acetyltransferase [Flavobacteriales bacterium]